MKTGMSANLVAHMALVVRTTCWLIVLTRTDGQVQRFTTLDGNVTLGGNTYLSLYGFSPTGLHSAAGGAVDNMELISILNSGYVKAADIMAGIYDNARVEMYRCNYKSTGDGVEFMKTGFVGEISFGDLAYQAELRGLAQALQQTIGEVSQAACRADLYDTRCKVSPAAFTVALAVTSVTDNARFADNATANIINKADGYFASGEIAWTGGNNNGKVMEIKKFTQAGGLFELFLPMQGTVQAGDTANVKAGCDKTLTTCKTKFNNVVNHRGDPYHRNKDFLMDTPDAA